MGMNKLQKSRDNAMPGRILSFRFGEPSLSGYTIFKQVCSYLLSFVLRCILKFGIILTAHLKVTSTKAATCFVLNLL